MTFRNGPSDQVRGPKGFWNLAVDREKVNHGNSLFQRHADPLDIHVSGRFHGSKSIDQVPFF